jgi:general secretion pathway protein I
MKRSRGFTLLEILLAMLILSGGIMLLANSWSGSFARVRKTQINTEVAALLERKMVEIELKYRGKPLESIPEEEGDDFGEDAKDYRWTLVSKEFEMPDISAALTARDGGADSNLIQIMKLFTDHLKKTIKEVKVSVYYKPSDSKEMEFSISTFFIDYDKEIPLPGGPS